MRLGHSADALLQVPAEKKKCAALLHCATLSVHELPQYLVPLLSASRGRIACVVILGHAKLLAKRPFCGKAKKKKKHSNAAGRKPRICLSVAANGGSTAGKEATPFLFFFPLLAAKGDAQLALHTAVESGQTPLHSPVGVTDTETRVVFG